MDMKDIIKRQLMGAQADATDINGLPQPTQYQAQFPYMVNPVPRGEITQGAVDVGTQLNNSILNQQMYQPATRVLEGMWNQAYPPEQIDATRQYYDQMRQSPDMVDQGVGYAGGALMGLPYNLVQAISTDPLTFTGLNGRRLGTDVAETVKALEAGQSIKDIILGSKGTLARYGVEGGKPNPFRKPLSYEDLTRMVENKAPIVPTHSVTPYSQKISLDQWEKMQPGYINTYIPPEMRQRAMMARAKIQDMIANGDLIDLKPYQPKKP